MVWDKDIPTGASFVSQGDNTIRANNAANEAAVDLEHYFATGGTQDGRHKIGIGNDAARDFAIPSPLDGNIWLNTKDYSANGWMILQVYYATGVAWKDTGYLDANVAELDTAQVWSAGQAGTYTTFSTSSSDWNWNCDTSQYFKGTLPDAGTREIQAPTGTLFASNNAGSWTLEVTQAPTTASTLTLDPTYFFPAYGGQPPISTVLGSINMVYVTLRSNSTFFYSVVPA